MHESSTFGVKTKAVALFMAVALFGGGILIGTRWNTSPEILDTSEHEPLPIDAPSAGPNSTYSTRPTRRSSELRVWPSTVTYLEGLPGSSHGVSFFSMTWPYGERELAIPIPNYIPDVRKTNDIYKILQEAHLWIPEDFCDYPVYYPMVSYASDQYFSIRLFYQRAVGWTIESMSYCALLDIENESILYLDDLVEVEELAKLILTSGYLRFDPAALEKYPDGSFPQDVLDAYELEDIQATLALYSQPYDEDNYYRKPCFYLTPGRLNILNLFGAQYTDDTYYYFELDDIEHLLKVDKW